MTWRGHGLIALSFLALGSSVGFGATLTGRIYSDQGPPVANILVTVQSTVAPPTGQVAYQAVTDAHGKFTVTVPAGATYSVCSVSALQGLLNSCEWDLARSLVPVPSGAAAAQITLTLISGVTLRYRLSDPGGLVPRPGAPATSAPAAGTAAPTIQLGLWDSEGHFHQIPVVSGDDKGLNFQILVPAGDSFTLSAWGANLQVTDQAGASVLNSTRSVSLTPSSLGQTPVFNAAAPPAAPPVPAPAGVTVP